ncbi:MAG: TonB-dependent receptor [Tannerella sp.]|jgi:TonB-linked SusC/RagA family outer membrane protein|nr:TonB-dependent receptor [Tannerella sp.]
MKKFKMKVRSKIVFSTIMLLMISCPFAFVQAEEIQPSIPISGEVLDADNLPLPGVTVRVQGTTIGTATNVDGRFTLTVPDENSVLLVSSVGYGQLTVTVGRQRTFRIVMQEVSSELEEVVVVGYGVQKKVSVTGAVSSVQTKDLKVSSSASIANALAGRITGLTSMQSIGGQPGRDDATLYLRGAATTNGKNPLILIDGVPRDNIRTIDPNEVESISVLKDASATSVFGVRGANGVILITTRRGKEGKPELTINATQSYSALTREPSRLHSLDYLALRNQALINDGQAGDIFGQDIFDKFENPLLGLDPNDPDYERKAAVRRYMYPDHDYYRELIARWSPQTSVNANLSGGTEKISYFINVGYLHQGGNLKTEPESVLGYDPSVKLDRYSFRSNVDFKIAPSLKAFLNLGTYIEGVNMPTPYGDDQNWMMRDIFYQAQSILPISPGPVTIAGFGVEAGMPLDPTYLNSGTYLDRSAYMIINWNGYMNEVRANLNSSAGLEWDLGFITKGLSAKGMISYDSWSTTETRGEYGHSLYRANVDPNTDELTYTESVSGTNALSLSKSAQSKYTINAQASILYHRQFGLHDVGGMILAQRDYWETTGADIPYNVLGLAGRITYSYDTRYFGEINAGYNGSEQFSPKKRFGFFPAASAGWLLSNEGFLKDNSILTYLKLRGSVGRVGNDQMVDTRFLYIDNITYGGGGYLGSISQGYRINEGLLGNPNLTWEVATKYNIGLDFRLLNDFSVAIDVFKENRSQILLQRQSVPVWQGVPLTDIPRVNMGEVDNRGYEIELGYNKQINKDFLVQVKGNFAYNRNERLNVDEVPRDDTYAYRTRNTGFPIGQNWGYVIDRSQDGGYWTPEALADPNRMTYDFGAPRPGDFVYADLNDDGVISDKDQAPIGYGNIPRMSWGASLNVEYKGFDAYVFFQGLSKYNRAYSNQGTYEITSRGTYFDYHRKAWTEERWRNGEEITYPALSTGAKVNHVANSFFIMDRSFARLKNVEIGYTLPPKTLKALGISKMRVFLQGQNVFTWSPNFPATHLDPENDDSIGYPQTKTFSFGTNITF